MSDEPYCARCARWEVVGRLQERRADALLSAVLRISKARDLAKAKAIADDAIRLDGNLWSVAHDAEKEAAA